MRANWKCLCSGRDQLQTHVVGAKESRQCYDQLQVAVDSGLSCQCALPLMLVLTIGICQWSLELGIRLGACRCSAGGVSRRLAQWCRLVIEDQAESGPTCSYRRLDYQCALYSCTVSPQACTQLWRLVTEIRLGVCRYTDGGTSSRWMQWYSSVTGDRIVSGLTNICGGLHCQGTLRWLHSILIVFIRQWELVLGLDWKQGDIHLGNSCRGAQWYRTVTGDRAKSWSMSSFEVLSVHMHLGAGDRCQASNRQIHRG